MLSTKLIILFGSRTTGMAKAGSDYDIAVWGDNVLDLEQKSAVSQNLASELGVSEDKIDITDLNTASPLLRYEVSIYGKLLRGSEEDFLRFKVSSWKLYQDTARFRQARRQALNQSSHA